MEKYSWKVVGRSPLPRYWQHLVIGVVLLVILASLKYAKYSVVGARNIDETIWVAAKNGDYATAQRLYESCTAPQCHTVTEDMVYPERKVERRIAELEGKLEEYPSDREIFLNLAGLYDQLGNQEVANEYREKARILDPNGAKF